MSREYKPRANREEKTCARCSAPIAPYAGLALSQHGSKFTHHAGQCADRGQVEAATRAAAGQGALFAWSCRRIERSASSDDFAETCAMAGTDRGAFAEHMKAHGARGITADRPIRLRKSAPAAKLPPVELPPLKFVRWTHRTYSEWQAGVGQTCTETEMRGQFWSNGPHPHSIWVLPVARGYVPPVLLFVANGRAYEDFSEAKRDRREAGRRAA